MHILIALITAITSLLWALDRLGVDLGGFNPFYWNRRRKWQKQYQTKPLHLLNRPVEAATVILVGLVNAEGAMSREQKDVLLKIFMEEFEKSADEAADMLGAGAFLLKDTMDIAAEVPLILEPNKADFSEDQVASLFSLMEKVARLEGEITTVQQNIIDKVKNEFTASSSSGRW
jgi:uncharacterized tellurite resistance protein B-like protein